MIPLTPASALTRTKQFVQEEWNTYFTDSATDPASKVTGGWKGILYANLALVDPVASFNFFNDEGFDASWLDGGASRTWYLALAAGEWMLPFLLFFFFLLSLPVVRPLCSFVGGGRFGEERLMGELGLGGA